MLSQTTMVCLDGRYRITLSTVGGRRQELDLELREGDEMEAPQAQRLRLRRSEVFAPDGSTEWRVTYDDYRFVRDPDDAQRRGVVMPYTVRFVDPRSGADTLVRFTGGHVLDGALFGRETVDRHRVDDRGVDPLLHRLARRHDQQTGGDDPGGEHRRTHRSNEACWQARRCAELRALRGRSQSRRAEGRIGRAKHDGLVGRPGVRVLHDIFFAMGTTSFTPKFVGISRRPHPLPTNDCPRG